MATQFGPWQPVPAFPLLSSSPWQLNTVEKELALYDSLSLFGLALLGQREHAVVQLCQYIEDLTQRQVRVQLFQRTNQTYSSAEVKQAFALLREHDYTIHLHGRYYGWLVTPDHLELSPVLMKQLARLCSMLFYIYEASVFLNEQVPFSPHIFDYRLTSRQSSVLHFMAQGYDDPEIAQALSITPATVRKHREIIYAKLSVHSSREAVQVAFLTGLYQPLKNLSPIIFLEEPEQDA